MTKMRLVGMAITLALSATLVTVGAQGGAQQPQPAAPQGQAQDTQIPPHERPDLGWRMKPRQPYI